MEVCFKEEKLSVNNRRVLDWLIQRSTPLEADVLNSIIPTPSRTDEGLDFPILSQYPKPEWYFILCTASHPWLTPSVIPF